MNDLIIVKPERCIGCNACIRNCPAPEANATKLLEDGRYITTVNSDKCIGCGKCLKVCSHDARDYIDDTRACMQRLQKDKTIILVSPTIKTVYPTRWIGILDWFKSKGCTIFDVSFGADICTWAHLKAMDEQKINRIISQPCAAVVKYIETYQPSLIRNLSPVQSPVGCAAIYIKKYLRRTNPIAVLTPCIAQKHEFNETGLIEYTITFEKLNEYFDANGIIIHNNSSEEYDYKFDDQQGQYGAIYSRPAGFKDNLLLHTPDLSIVNSEGVNKIYRELDLYAEIPESKRPRILDLLSCEYGCNLGPASGSKATPFDVMNQMKIVEAEAIKRRKTSVFRSGEDKLFKKFSEDLNYEEFLRTYNTPPLSPIPSDKQLNAVFKLMGKTTDADKSYNCQACGYNSCRDMATAICRGLTTPNNCVIHSRDSLNERRNNIAGQQERFSEVTDNCRKLSEDLQSKMNSIRKNLENICDSTKKTSEKSRVVNDLLTNIITFCKNNTSLDADGINQMGVILETTLNAFKGLDENISVTNQNSEMITKAISEIKSGIESINKALGDTARMNISK